jgi:threonine/homoserine/homoserine lactone efflux protein
LRRGVAGGFRPAALVQTGALLGDLAWAVIGITGAIVLIQHDAIATLLGLIGAGLLFALARSALRSALLERADTGPGDLHTGGAFAVGIMFSFANPAGLAFWTGLGGGLLATNQELSAGETALLLGAFLIGSVIWGCGMSALVSWGRRFTGGRVFRWIDGLCAAALSYFGIRLLWSTLQRAGRWLTPFMRALS